jgi:hypothetical protein
MLTSDPGMLTSVHTLLRRHRRQVRWALAVFAILASGLAVHSLAMSGAMSDHAAGDAAALCMAVGGSLAFAGAAVAFAARRPSQHPNRLVDVAAAPATAFIPDGPWALVRAGPPGSQVLRL